MTELVIKNNPNHAIHDLKKFDGHEMVIALTDARTGLKGYIGIHNTNLGPALGGTRMWAYESEDQALEDVLSLSRAMSYKCALAGLPYGGGKGVIVIDQKLSGEQRQHQLAAYAKLIDKLRGHFKTGTDMGVSDEDVTFMGQFTSHMLGLKEADRGNLTTSEAAAIGVYNALKAGAEEALGVNSLEGLSVSIKGVGKLGGKLAELVHQDGAKVFVADIDTARCQQLASQLQNVEVVSIDKIHSVPADIYAPCASGNEFNRETIKELRCKVIAGGANNQLADENAGDELYEAGILYVPDYIANSGGLIYVADELETDGFSLNRVYDRLEGIKATLRDIFIRSSGQGRPTHSVADDLARERMGLGRDD